MRLGNSINDTQSAETVGNPQTQRWQDRKGKSDVKREIASMYIAALKKRSDPQVLNQISENEIYQHFQLLPTRYALDVNLDSLDVIAHKRLLQEARKDINSVYFQVRVVAVSANGYGDASDQQGLSNSGMDYYGYKMDGSGRHLQRPAFGSSPCLMGVSCNAQTKVYSSVLYMYLALAQEAGDKEESQAVADTASFFEVTLASRDQPKLLSFYSNMLGDTGLNIREAHAFNLQDGFTLDVFVCDGWKSEEKGSLEQCLSDKLTKLPEYLSLQNNQQRKSTGSLNKPTTAAQQESMLQQQGVGDDWEIDVSNLSVQHEIAQGSFGTLYVGRYCGQEVAIKIIKNVNDDTQQMQEFKQEISIMRKVRHRNVVQFIGACTRPPNLCIVFEYMSSGSVHDYIRRGNVLSIPAVLKISLEVAKGMDYLHQCNIVHRDLKAANLLLDENGTVKIADFGVARIVDTSCIMTAETGTYRWMAPEVIEHKPYNSKADIFSFGILLWELITGKVPYQDLTPLQAAVAVVQKGLRPPVPSHCPPNVQNVMQQCWQQQPSDRPTFSQIIPLLTDLLGYISSFNQKKQPSLINRFIRNSSSK